MFWKINSERCEAGTEELERADGRFVLYRHGDSKGPHFDLRLEQGDYLFGLRICGEALDEETWAIEKAPHPPSWLERDGNAIRVDAGAFAWADCDKDSCTLLLKGKISTRRLRVTRELKLPIEAARGVCEAVKACGTNIDKAGSLIRDGVTARQRAIARFCGLGRELDGAAFDEGIWRKALDTLSLDEIHSQLRALEVRFDRKYPPAPVSRPERLDEEKGANRSEAALAIING